MYIRTTHWFGLPLRLCLVLILSAMISHGDDGYYTDEQVFSSRPPTDREMHVGHIGPTGIKARYYPGPVLRVEAVEPGTPAAGKLEEGDEITHFDCIIEGLKKADLGLAAGDE